MSVLDLKKYRWNGWDKHKALIVVDMQNDFITGTLPVPKAESIVPTVIDCIKACFMGGGSLILTQDWHPENHISFKEWPVHCVQHTHGSEIEQSIKDIVAGLHEYEFYVRKGTEKDKECYSGFCMDESNVMGVTLLEWTLEQQDIREVVICGLATDYCVKATALDAIKHGYSVTIVLDAIRAVNVGLLDGSTAIAEMIRAGVNFV